MMSGVVVRPNRGLGMKLKALRKFRGTQAWVIVAIIYLGLLAVRPQYVTGASGSVLVLECSLLGVLTVGEGVVMIGGGIDLSIAANVGLSNVVGAIYFGGKDPSFLIGVAIVIGVSVAIGALNGVLIGVLKMPPFITTLAVMLGLNGVTLMIANSAVGSAPSSLVEFYAMRVVGIPGPTLILILVLIVMSIFLVRTVWGKSVYATGGSPTLAEYAGIRVRRTRISLYMVAGAMAGVTAVLYLARSGVGNPMALDGLELQAITAAVIGGVSLFGGRGSVIGGLGGVVFLTIIAFMLSEVGVGGRFLSLAEGVVILGALSTFRQKSDTNL